MRHGWGIYLPNDGDPQVDLALELVGSGCYTILHHQLGNDDALRRIRRAQPEALIQVRCYLANWYSTPPDAWARSCHAIMHGGPDPVARYTRHFTWANEQNLALESGGAIGATETRLATWNDYLEIARWNEAFVAAYRRLDGTDQDVLHYPGLAYGHGEDWGYDRNHQPLPGFPLDGAGAPIPAYEVLRAGIDQCPILNHHPYKKPGKAVTDEWEGARRIEKTIALFPDKAIYAAETGNFEITSDHAPQDLAYIGYYLQRLPTVVGWTPFILKSPDPAHRDNDWSRNARVGEVYKATTRLAARDLWVGWEPPGESTVPDIVLSVPMRSTHAAEGNYKPGPRATTIGVVIHTTRGGASTVENEYVGTINWFTTAGAEVSAHLVVGAGKFEEVCRSVHDDEIAYHARENNATHLSIEIVQPNAASPISDFQYRAAAEACRLWAATYKFPLRRVMTQTQPGLIGHQDTEAGKRDGKSDPGPVFDWTKFMTLVGGTVPTTPPTTVDIVKERDALWATAERLEKAGYPWLGQAIKSAVALSKGEK